MGVDTRILPARPLTPAEQHSAALAVVTAAHDQGWLDEARDVLGMLGLGVTA